MELATGTLPVQAPKAALPTDAWGDFLKRVLVSTGSGGNTDAATPALAAPLPQPSVAPVRREEVAAEQ